MDKNFVNIDDLVRQRLSGGEEREQPGAWMRMSELLDKEMPEKRVVGLFWKRMFSVVAVMVLIGAISLGGYKVSNYYKNLDGGGHDGSLASATHSNSDAATTPGNTASPASQPDATGDNGSGNTPGNNNGHNTVVAAADHNSNTGAADNTNQPNNKEAKKTIHHTAIADNNVKGNNSRTNSSATPDGGHTGNGIADRSSKPATNNGSKAPESKDNSVNTVSGNAPVAGNTKADAGKPAKTQDDAVVTTNDTRKATPAAAEKAKPAHDNAKKDLANKKKTQGTPATAAPSASADNTADKVVATNNNKKTGKPAEKVADVKPSKLPLGSGASPTTGSKSVATSTPARKVSAKKTAPATPAVVAAAPGSTKKAPGHALAFNADKNKKPATHKVSNPADNSNENATADDNSIATPAASTGAGKPANKTVAAKSNKSKTATKTTAEETAAVTPKQKKMVQKTVVTQHLVKKDNKDDNFRLDTVSIEQVSEEVELANNTQDKMRNAVDNTAVASVPTPVDRNADTSPVPGSSKSSFEESKLPAREKESKFARTIQNMSAAFNEMKYKAGHAQFSPGIIGGINSTFFGPNSFKGFQFGATGRFAFSDAVSVAGELKYFHRINSGYTLDDNYSVYTPTAGGFNKLSITNQYAISTLHSIEMPVMLQYSIGNFNFMIGANMVYCFGINTGRYIDPNPPVATHVTTAGNDDLPKIGSGDFNSRFGLGYVFGVSYNVTSRVTFDLRDVQTAWTNASTTGSQFVSSQLYRSPSFQLSVGYRFGGNKNSRGKE